jgi:hypothetical protein
LSGCISIRRTRPLAVDEKSQMQALDRSAPMLPMMPGVAGRQIHDYVRYGTTSLFAALDVATGTVIGQHQRRHRHQESCASSRPSTRTRRPGWTRS